MLGHASPPTWDGERPPAETAPDLQQQFLTVVRGRAAEWFSQSSRPGAWRWAMQPLAQAVARDIFHHDVEDLLNLVGVVGAHHVGVIEAADQLHLPLEPSHHPLVQRTIAEMATRLRAGRLLLSEAARVKMSGDSAAVTVAINQAKYFCTEIGVWVTEQAMRLAGGRSILRALPLERWHRDALAGPVMPTANDRCLETVGKILSGLEAYTLELD